MNDAFSIIVLNHNNLYIDYCIESIKKYKGQKDEIIIVDDNSTPENYQNLLRHTASDCKILQNTTHPHNLSYSRNLGAENAQNNYYLFLDGDAYFYDDSIEQLRKGLNLPEIVCATGYADAMGIAPLQMELVYKEKFMQHIQNGTLDILSLKHFARDHRRTLPMSALQGDHNWIYFYGICLAIKKNAFLAAGKFDEKLSGWGIEDLDMNFRIRKQGKLLFVPEAKLFHIPHTRNRYKNFQQNAYNNMECTKKYAGDMEWEVNYKLNNIYEAMSVLGLVKYHHRNLSYQIPMENIQSAMYINAISPDYPNGNIIVYNENGKAFFYTHIGICIPLKNKQLKTCYVSMYILNYPAPILSLILQEACRVACEVRILKTALIPAIKWSKDIEKKCSQHTQRFDIYPVKLSDFIFQDRNQYYEITTSLPDTPYQADIGVYYEIV